MECERSSRSQVRSPLSAAFTLHSSLSLSLGRYDLLAEEGSTRDGSSQTTRFVHIVVPTADISLDEEGDQLCHETGQSICQHQEESGSADAGIVIGR